MLEWVRVGQPTCRPIEEDTEQLTCGGASRAGRQQNARHGRGNTLNLEPPWPRMKMADAIAKFTGYADARFQPPVNPARREGRQTHGA